MEVSKQEVEAVTKTLSEVQSDIQQLADLQLALVGGGSGDPAFV